MDKLKSFKELARNERRLFVFAFREIRYHVLGVFLLATLLSILSFLSSGAMALLINAISSGTNLFSPAILAFTALYVIATFLPDILTSIRIYIEKRNWITLSERLQLMIFKKAGAIDIQTHDDPKFKDLEKKVNERDVWPATNMIEQQSYMFQNILDVVIALIILFTFKPWITLVVIVAIIPQFISEIKYGKETWSIWDADANTRRRFQDYQGHFQDRTRVVELKLFQNINYFYEKIKEILVNFNNKQQKIEKGRLVFEIIATVVSGALISIVVVWIISNTLQGAIAVGSMLFALGAVSRLQGSLTRFLVSLAREYERSLYVSNIFNYLKVDLALTRPANPFILTNPTPEIIFENVSFSYPHSGTTKEKGVLRNISVTIKPGEKFALIGENGAGKTTFVKLLTRVYDPTVGRILIDGRDLKDIDLTSWYSTLGILFQEYASYHFPVKEAIALGRSDVPMVFERIEEAARGSESDSFISEWKDKYDQMIGTEFEGIDPSKGQSQRLAVARLLYRKAGVMILDEPTASVDAEAEMRIFEKLETLSKQQTVILISHKYSTVRRTDRICVFKDGTIEELGSHNELIAKDGLYARLFREQAKGYLR